MITPTIGLQPTTSTSREFCSSKTTHIILAIISRSSHKHRIFLHLRTPYLHRSSQLQTHKKSISCALIVGAKRDLYSLSSAELRRSHSSSQNIFFLPVGLLLLSSNSNHCPPKGNSSISPKWHQNSKHPQFSRARAVAPAINRPLTVLVWEDCWERTQSLPAPLGKWQILIRKE